MTKSKTKPFALVAGAILILVVVSFFAISASPGLHYDEAWAFNFAAKIASTPNFWPWQAMSPYTSPWVHYFVALCFKLFGTSLAVFRGSQATLGLLGIFLFLRALPSAQRTLTCIGCALLPGLLLNQRFAIELHGFHLFCFGVFAFSLARKQAPLAALAFVVGTTAHILFYGVGLGLMAAIMMEGRRLARKERLSAIGAFFLLTLFFARVLGEIPEQGKGLALVASAIAGIALLVLQAERWAIWQRRELHALLLIGACPFLVNAIFFAEGSWNLGVQTGVVVWQNTFGLIELVSAVLLLLFLSVKGLRAEQKLLRHWFLAGVFFLGVMMLKPAPRYFEIALLALSLFAVHGWRLLQPRLRLALGTFFSLHALGLYAFALTAVAPDELDLRFLFFKDTTRDFLSKQTLATKLGGLGCSVNDIDTGDSRLKEALHALAHQDWPMNAGASCGGIIRVDRRREANLGPRAEEFAGFVLQRSQ